MKFQPMMFHEQMDDFFGKRGRSWHVTCVIKGGDVSGDQRVEVETFVHLHDACVRCVWRNPANSERVGT